MLHLEDRLLWMLRLQQRRWYWFDCPPYPVFHCPSIDYLSKYLILSMLDYHFHRFADLQWFQMHTALAASSSCHDKNILVFVVDKQWHYFVVFLTLITLQTQ